MTCVTNHRDRRLARYGSRRNATPRIAGSEPLVICFCSEQIPRCRFGMTGAQPKAERVEPMGAGRFWAWGFGDTPRAKRRGSTEPIEPK